MRKQSAKPRSWDVPQDNQLNSLDNISVIKKKKSKGRALSDEWKRRRYKNQTAMSELNWILDYKSAIKYIFSIVGLYVG